jgi:hypothetical protein
VEVSDKFLCSARDLFESLVDTGRVKIYAGINLCLVVILQFIATVMPIPLIFDI